MTVSNPKISGLAPLWAPFPGFSLLFDNPGKSPCRLWKGKNLKACDVNGEPAVNFYKALFQGLSSFDAPLLTSTYGLCTLPPHSYHVTVFDGANAGNLPSVLPSFSLSLQEMFAGLPETWNESHSAIRPLATSEIVANKAWRISMRYKKLRLWDHQALVATLETASLPSNANLELLIRARAALSSECKARFGFGVGSTYTPHVTLAYFLNREGAALAQPRMQEWDELLAEKTHNHTINFDSVSVFAFSDMATFFKS